MYTDTEGIILKQIKILNNRRMISLFSRKFGKISAGTSISEKGRGKSALAMRPFTYGKYELYKSRDSYHINGAHVIKSYYKIGEDVEKYMYCSYVLEYTDKILHEEAPAVEIFDLIIDFFAIMERRSKKYSSLILAYQLKSLQYLGCMPEITCCTRCGSKESVAGFSVKDGGLLCENCYIKVKENPNETLIYSLNSDIVDILKYILQHPIKNLESLAIEERLLNQLKVIIKSYISVYLDINNLKSESFLIDNV